MKVASILLSVNSFASILEIFCFSSTERDENIPAKIEILTVYLKLTYSNSKLSRKVDQTGQKTKNSYTYKLKLS